MKRSANQKGVVVVEKMDLFSLFKEKVLQCDWCKKEIDDPSKLLLPVFPVIYVSVILTGILKDLAV